MACPLSCLAVAVPSAAGSHSFVSLSYFVPIDCLRQPKVCADACTSSHGLYDAGTAKSFGCVETAAPLCCSGNFCGRLLCREIEQ